MYDYIVIGSGSGGAVMASRLSEDPSCSVLLLEAGGSDWNFVFHMAIGFYRNRPAHLNWGFQSEPERELGDRRVDLPQGKVLGGSSSINGKVYARGNPLDYDLWRQMGCEGWSYRDVLPYFKKAETNWRGEGEFHGGSGPLQVSPIKGYSRLQEPLLEAARRLGYPISDDLDGAQWEGVARNNDITVDSRGRRSSTAKAYLASARQRHNLEIALRAKATRLVVEQGRVVGVDYVQDGQLRQARAEREVIVCSGNYNTPRLLLLSGIGPGNELSAVGIKPIHDLPGVGKNIADHASVLLQYQTKAPITPMNELRLDRAAVNFAQWALAGTGAFASQPLMAQARIKTEPDMDRPDIQIFFNPLRRDAKIWTPGMKNLEHRMEAAVVMLHPHSRGSLTLRSSDPADPPRIKLNLLSDPRDLHTMMRGVRATREFYNTAPLSDLIDTETVPGPAVTSDADLEAYIRRTLYTVRHPVGSCRMGDDNMAVVDPQLRVRGLEGLRIADSSIMPTIPGGNTNAPTIMIAEKGADMIRGHQVTNSSLSSMGVSERAH